MGHVENAVVFRLKLTTTVLLNMFNRFILQPCRTAAFDKRTAKEIGTAFWEIRRL